MGTSIYKLVLMVEMTDMVIAIATASVLITQLDNLGSRLPAISPKPQHPGRFSHTWTPFADPGGKHRACKMPRIRGRSRRGAAWYAAQSRRKRKESFERAMAMATRRRRQKLRRPQRWFEEEQIPEEGPNIQPEHALLAAPVNWHPASSSGLAGPSQQMEDTPAEERPYTPCYVVEEPPPEPTKEEEAPNRQSDKAATTEEREDNHHAEKHPSMDWDLLNLLFEIKQQLEDQVFRMTRLEQRLDMFFAAHSRATPKKQCPTCARVYAFPARWKHSAMVSDTHQGPEVI
jgi:hypothetical protein